ncbi:hypothetical protein [Selenomonas sp.]|uniref:hypothetical protein n=1 Tax=Selenomonas sp. TaxID=2053611 RepID=UPI0025D325DB|nr:hypothetical protein [Selenomonas sp.]MCI6283796.1 hypothetical protein [Selenomonas sp.]
MEEEKKSATDVMRDLLKGDRTLLARREELANAVQQSALPRKEKLALTKALTTTNICDLFAAADQGTDEDRATVVARATEALAGTKDAEAITQTLFDAMDWASEAAGETADTSDTDDAADEPAAAPLPSEPPAAPQDEPPAAPAKETEAPQAPWDCVCGQKANTGKFCVACGRARDLGEAKPAWTCTCGQTGNTGNFCVACGRSRVEGEAPAATAAQAPSPAASAAHTPPAADDATQVLPRVEEPVPQPAPQPAPQPIRPTYQEPTAREKAGNQSKALIAVIAILVIAIGVFVYKETASDTSTSSYSSLTKQSSSSSSSVAKEREMKSDLSLGGLDLDMTVDEVHKALGQENEIKTKNQFHFLEYDAIEVGVRNDNVVHSLVSNGPSVKTKRGIHEGSTLADVQKAYGTDCASMDYDDLMLYEYSFKSMSGNDGLLRFAIKKSDNTVKYISVRIPEDEKPAANNDADANAAAQVLNKYYQTIANGNTSTAYNLLSADMQRHMGTLDQFKSGYQTTISHQLSDMNLVSSGDNQVVISYLLTARDRTPSKRVKVQVFRCEATLSKATGSWHIVNLSATKQGERME